MNFFKPGCFYHLSLPTEIDQKVRDCANAMLKHDGKVVYGQMHSHDHGSFTTHPNPCKEEWPLKHTHQALLISIEPIAKCEHPKGKIKVASDCAPSSGKQGCLPRFSGEYYQCKCGARVEPESFKECK